MCQRRRVKVEQKGVSKLYDQRRRLHVKQDTHEVEASSNITATSVESALYD